MVTPCTSDLDRPKSWIEFEEICADLFSRLWGDANASLNGRPGQRQNGVDIYGNIAGRGYVGVQCKGKRTWPPNPLTRLEITDEVDKAKQFSPPLAELVIATTALDDANLQEHARDISEKHEKEGLFRVVIMGWGELTRRLTQYPDLIEKHYGYVLNAPLRDEIRRSAEATAFLAKETKVSNANFSKLTALYTERACDLDRDPSTPKLFYPTALVDEKIECEVEILCKSRFFIEFDRIRASLVLAKKLVEGELSGGTDTVRSRALAWCARILSRSNELGKAEEYLKLAKDLGTGPEIEIAQAFIRSQKGDKSLALSTLAKIDAPISRSAALMVVAHHDGSVGVVDWLNATGINVRDLDPDGKHFLLTHQLELARWEAARDSLSALIDNDFCKAPALYHVVALTQLLITVPNELRAIVFKQLPFEAATFPLASDPVALDARRVAQRHFVSAVQVAQQLNCPIAATLDDEYGLWLELRDPDESDNGKRRLEAKLRDPKSALRLVHLGLQFGITLDLEAVKREIDRQIALHGGITHDAAIARFALAFTQNTPEEVANYIARHREELAKFIDEKLLQFLQIEMLSRAGLPDRANECLDFLVEHGLSESDENRLRITIAESEGTDPIEALTEQFKRTESLRDLMGLCDELEARNKWDSYCKYGEILFERTQSLSDAERLAKSLSMARKHEGLIEFLNINAVLLAQSQKLQMYFCWALYHEGALLQARSELMKLSGHGENPNYRALQINLAIALGDWSSLHPYLAKECSEQEKRSAQDLIRDAQLALHVGSPHAKDLLFAAARKGREDASVLASAYFLASRAGWENNSEVFNWLHEAAARSGNDGPIQTVTLKDVLDRKPEWDRRESETWRLLSRGDIPMFLAAQSLNKSLIDFMLFPALANLVENDPRRRGIVPAYSGTRQLTPLNTLGLVAGFDATALLTLSFLNLLDKAMGAFDTVYLPHSTLTWLFEEKQRATFIQPSRVEAAHQVRNFLATDILSKFIPSAVPDSDLSAQIGEELAWLIAEAEKASDNNVQRIVVRPSPVHRLASLMEEEADLTAHASVLSSCQAIVDKLRENGQITAEEEKNARAYLQIKEKPWSHQPEIADGAILYLDDLAIAYFLHLKMLEKLRTAGFRPIASPSKIAETNELIAYESISGKINDTIERIRSIIHSQIVSEKVKIYKRRNNTESETQSIIEHPCFDVFALVSVCDAIIADDRFLNQRPNIREGSAQVPIYSTWDLLDALVSNGTITNDYKMECRTLLRRAGYLFVPVSEDELAHQLNASTIKDGKVVEAAELKAIRENLLRVRMSSWLQLPKEAPWLDTSLNVFIKVLKSLWRVDAALPSIRARSDWILEQVDVRGWAHCFRDEDGSDFVNTKRGAHVLMVITPPVDVPPEIKVKYWDWVEARVLTPIKEQHIDLYSWIIDWYRGYLTEMTDLDLTSGEQCDQ